MTLTTVTHSPATLRVLAGRGVDGAWEALVAACQPPTFDSDALAAAISVYPAPRSLGQAVTSGTWGRDEVYTRTPARRLRIDQHDLWEGTGRWVEGGVNVEVPASVTVSHTVTGGAGIGTRAGLSFRLTVGPGVAALAVTDEVRREASAERVRKAERTGADVAAAFLAGGEDVPDRIPSRMISEWSARSRSRMVRAFASVDWSDLAVPGEPIGMVTLTYPGDWLAVAPNGKTVKRHLAAFRRRFARATGRRLDGAWKLEFQRRGAPHFHLLVPVPALVVADGGYGPRLGYRVPESFESWLSRTWADVVGATGQERVKHEAAGTAVDFASTGRMSDPKRLAVYFLKHGTKTSDGKEYQHNVPREWLVDGEGEVTPDAGPGRFWGFWGMKPATFALDLDADDFIAARRVLRKVAAARARSTAYSRARHTHTAAAAIRMRRGRSHVLRSSRMVGGFVVVNDGVRLAGDLARWVNLNRIQ